MAGLPSAGTPSDVRYTKSKDGTALYAIFMGWPGNGKQVTMASVTTSAFPVGNGKVYLFGPLGGSAIELLTDGAYTSGDVDLCRLTPAALPLRQRQEIMGQLGAQGGPRSWQVAGAFVDLLGSLESLARTPLRKLQGAYGVIQVAQPEELLVERVLVSVYPQPHPPARECAKKLAAVALGGAMQFDWKEVRRLATLREYRILPTCKALVREVAHELETKSPLDSNE